MSGRPALSHPMLSLAQAHALLAHQCKRAAIAPTLQLRGRPVPWVLGFAETHLVIAEPWSHHAALHRRKRGFTAMVQRWSALESLIETEVGARSLRLELWQDEPDIPIDNVLIEKVGKQLGRPIACFGPAKIRTVLERVQTSAVPDHATHENPVLAVFGWTNAFRSEDEANALKSD